MSLSEGHSLSLAGCPRGALGAELLKWNFRVWAVTTSVQRMGILNNPTQRNLASSLLSQSVLYSVKCLSPLRTPWIKLMKVSAMLIFILSTAGDHGCIMPPEEACFLFPSNELSVQGSHLWCDVMDVISVSSPVWWEFKTVSSINCPRMSHWLYQSLP